jgi:TPR repeat protein
MTALGYCYGAGAGVKQDLALSAWWYRRAADHGSVAAMISLSVCYHEGTGIRKDNRESARWVRRAINSATHTE